MLYDSKGTASWTLLQAREHTCKLGLTSPHANGEVVNDRWRTKPTFRTISDTKVESLPRQPSSRPEVARRMQRAWE
jgi:hypothetical protein